MGFVTTRTKNTMRSALIGLSKKYKVKPSDVKILILMPDENSMPEYYVKASDFYGKVEFKELIFSLVDVFNTAELAPPFIKEALIRISKDAKLVGDKRNVGELKVSITCAKDDAEGNPYMFLFVNNVPIKEMTFDYFIEGEN